MKKFQDLEAARELIEEHDRLGLDHLSSGARDLIEFHLGIIDTLTPAAQEWIVQSSNATDEVKKRLASKIKPSL